MTRKGELSRAQLHLHWPHHVALPSDKVRGAKNSKVVRGFASVLRRRLAARFGAADAPEAAPQQVEWPGCQIFQDKYGRDAVLEIFTELADLSRQGVESNDNFFILRLGS
jgi:hypothetical protein